MAVVRNAFALGAGQRKKPFRGEAAAPLRPRQQTVVTLEIAFPRLRLRIKSALRRTFEERGAVTAAAGVDQQPEVPPVEPELPRPVRKPDSGELLQLREMVAVTERAELAAQPVRPLRRKIGLPGTGIPPESSRRSSRAALNFPAGTVVRKNAMPQPASPPTSSG